MNVNKFLYVQIMEGINKYIKDNNLKGDDLIPSEMVLSKHFKASRVSVRMAINKLVQDNILYKKRGSGTYVKKVDHSRLIGLTEEMRNKNKTISNIILDFKIISSPKEISEILELNENENIYYIERLRFSDGKPIVLEKSYMPVYLFKDLSIEVLNTSKYEYIEGKKEYKIKRSSQDIFPIISTEELEEKLNLEKNIPILNVRSIGTLENNKKFEYTNHFYNPKEYTYTIVAER